MLQGLKKDFSMMGSTKTPAVNQLIRNTSFSGFYKEIDDLTNINEYDYIGTLKEITRCHWKPVDNRSKCFNASCRKQFSSLLERPHHCRRCGEVFCRSCVQFSRRLNKIASLDPDGELYKVCQKCFEEGKHTEGQSRSHTFDFRGLRYESKKQGRTKAITLEITSIWRSRLNFHRECQRLLDGFEEHVASSDIKRTLHGIRSFVSIPEWLKSSAWLRESTATCCQVCQLTFSLAKKKNFCCVCGMAVCKGCSCKDLLLYIPDEDRRKEDSCKPKMAIIKIIGCPEVEPEISMHLRVCPTCKDKIEDQQVGAQEVEVSTPTGSEFMDILERVHGKFHAAEERVKAQLPEYRNIVDSLEDGSRKGNSRSNMKTLAKAQEDLADALAHHVTLVQQLKNLKPQTDTQASLLKTYIRAKCDFYLNNMSNFRSVKNKLSDSVPAESLDFIQRTMDKTAIISTHLCLRQLVFETLHLCDKYKLEDDMPKFLMGIEEPVEADVQKCLQAEKEDVESHMKLVTEMIKVRMKESKLIRPSRYHVNKEGSKHVYDLMNSRVENILNQINNQLHGASAYRSFSESKKAIEEAIWKVKFRKYDDRKETEEFVFLEKEDY